MCAYLPDEGACTLFFGRVKIKEVHCKPNAMRAISSVRPAGIYVQSSIQTEAELKRARDTRVPDEQGRWRPGDGERDIANFVCISCSNRTTNALAAVPGINMYTGGGALSTIEHVSGVSVYVGEDGHDVYSCNECEKEGTIRLLGNDGEGDGWGGVNHRRISHQRSYDNLKLSNTLQRMLRFARTPASKGGQAQAQGGGGSQGGSGSQGGNVSQEDAGRKGELPCLGNSRICLTYVNRSGDNLKDAILDAAARVCKKNAKFNALQVKSYKPLQNKAGQRVCPSSIYSTTTKSEHENIVYDEGVELDMGLIQEMDEEDDKVDIPVEDPRADVQGMYLNACV